MITFPRANPKELEKFDEATKRCVMNCGRHRDDPRTMKEVKLLCDDCAEYAQDGNAKRYRAGKGRKALYSQTLWEARENARKIAKDIGDGEYVSIYEFTPHHAKNYVPMACEKEAI